MAPIEHALHRSRRQPTLSSQFTELQYQRRQQLLDHLVEEQPTGYVLLAPDCAFETASNPVVTWWDELDYSDRTPVPFCQSEIGYSPFSGGAEADRLDSERSSYRLRLYNCGVAEAIIQDFPDPRRRSDRLNVYAEGVRDYLDHTADLFDSTDLVNSSIVGSVTFWNILGEEFHPEAPSSEDTVSTSPIEFDSPGEVSELADRMKRCLSAASIDYFDEV